MYSFDFRRCICLITASGFRLCFNKQWGIREQYFVYHNCNLTAHVHVHHKLGVKAKVLRLRFEQLIIRFLFIQIIRSLVSLVTNLQLKTYLWYKNYLLNSTQNTSYCFSMLLFLMFQKTQPNFVVPMDLGISAITRCA